MPVPDFIKPHLPALRASAALGNATANNIFNLLQSAPPDEGLLRRALERWMKSEEERTS